MTSDESKHSVALITRHLSLVTGVAPRLILPTFALNHALYVALVVSGDFDARFKLASLADGTLGVVFAAGVSWLLHWAKWNDFLKERTIAAQNRELARHNGEMRNLMAVAAHDLQSVARAGPCARNRSHAGRSRGRTFASGAG